MRFGTTLLSLCFVLVGALEDGCPKDEYACLDVINSSQCIEQLVIEKQAPATKEAMAKCVETEGVVSTLPGATKVGSYHFGGRQVNETVLIHVRCSSVDVQGATMSL